MQSGERTHSGEVVESHDDIYFGVSFNKLLHNGHGDFKLTETLRLRDDFKIFVRRNLVEKAAHSVYGRTRLRVLEQSNLAARRIFQKILGALNA